MTRTGGHVTGPARQVPRAGVRLPVERLDAVLFDLDVVVSQPDRATPYLDAVSLVSVLREAGLSTAVVAADRRGPEPVPAAGLDALFTAVVTGTDAERERLAVPPDPALLLHAARLLGVHPARTAVMHTAAAGVQAACRGGFGLTIGVDRRGGHEAELRRCGAELVLAGLDPVGFGEGAAQRRWWQIPRSAEPGAEHAGWLLDFTGDSPDSEGVRETLCTLGNGYLATRGAAPETGAGPVHYPGTYVAGLFNRLRSRVRGQTREVESLVKLPNWLVLRWRANRGGWVVPDGPRISEHRQSLDLRTGVLHRRYRHVDRRGRATTVVSRMLVSMATPHLTALETTFIAENWSGTLHVRSAIDGRVANTQLAEDARLANRHLRPDGQGRDSPAGLWLRTRTSQSRVDVAVATRTQVFVAGAPTAARRVVTMATARPAETLSVPIQDGQPVRVYKVAAYFTSHHHAITETAAAARQAVAQAGSFTDLLTAHVHEWRWLWERCHVEVHSEGGSPLLPLNVSTYHLLVTVPPTVVDLDAGVGARGLHGEGYRGHIFWDEVFVHRVLALHLPEASRALLLYRWRRLGAARLAAAAVGRRGAMFPWQSGSDGREETPGATLNPLTGQWMPEYTAGQRHVGLGVAYSVWQYYQATGDADFMRTYGGELILEIARFFADLAEENPQTGRYEITGVMGPDEFHDRYPGNTVPGVANNAYTNLMTVWLLRRAFDVVDLLACHRAVGLGDTSGVGEDELARWADITRRMYVPWHGEQVISQFDGYADLREFDLAGHAARHGDLTALNLVLAAEGDSPNRYQVSKQADVLMLLYLLSAEELRELLAGLGYPWPPEALPRTVDYYIKRVSHGSSLSRVVHAWVQARTDRAASWRCFTEALAADLGDSQYGSAREGIHLGAMAGTLDLAERCYLGLETRQDTLWINPRLPTEITRLHTMLTYRGHHVHLTATQRDLTIAASPCNVAPVNVHVAGQPPMTVSGGQEMTVPLKPSPEPAPAGPAARPSAGPG